MKEPNVERFMFYEVLFYRIQLSIMGLGIALFALLSAIINSVGDVSNFIVGVIYGGIILPAILFVISVIRIIYYYVKVSKAEGESSIWRSALAFVFSPLNIALYYLILLILIFASCAANV